VSIFFNFNCLELHKVGWSKEFPTLTERKNWWEKKWSSRFTGDLFRAKILNFFLIRNTYTGLVRLEFEYTTEKWSDLTKTWNWR
jgi:hypothetical protein